MVVTQDPTREKILDVARRLAVVDGPRRAFFEDLAKKPSEAVSDREIRAAWYAIRYHVDKLEEWGIDYEALVPPADPFAAQGKPPVEALFEASGSSIIVVRNWTDDQVRKLRSWLGIGYLWSALIVSLKDNQTIEMLSEKQMESAGWVRLSKAKKMVHESS